MCMDGAAAYMPGDMVHLFNGAPGACILLRSSRTPDLGTDFAA